MKPLVVKLNLTGGENSIIPKGVMETLTIEIVNELAAFHFQNALTTREFCKRQIKDGVTSRYNDRIQKTICKYPNMLADEILKHIKERLLALGAKVKNG